MAAMQRRDMHAVAREYRPPDSDVLQERREAQHWVLEHEDGEICFLMVTDII